MSPRDVLLSNIPDLLTAFADDYTPSQAYAKLAAINSPLATMPFNSFKTTAPVVVATIKHMQQTQVKLEQELAYVTEAYNHTLETLESTLTGYQEALSMTQSSVQKGIQNSVCLEQTNDTEGLKNIDNGGVQTSIQKHTPVMTEAQIIDIVRREIDQALHSVCLPPDNHTPSTANLFEVAVTETPAVYKGWSVNRGTDGYLRINRKIKGFNKTIHIGKVWIEAKAQAKIDKFMQSIGVND
jgi:hypothetical protein